MRTLLSLLIVFIAATNVPARQVHLSLPAHGDYQSGRMMSVEIAADDETARHATITLRAAGAVPTIVAMNGRASALAPMLMLSADAKDLSWAVASGEVHVAPLPMREKSGDEPAEHEIIAGNRDAYSPVIGWHPVASARTHRVGVLLAALASIIFLACRLLAKSRRVELMITAAIVGASILGIEVWRRHIPAIWRVGGQIIIQRADGSTQIDTWQYLTATRPARSSADLPYATLPIFVDLEQSIELDASVHFDAASSTTTIEFTLQPDLKLVIWSRKVVRENSSPAFLPPGNSPLISLAQKIYVDRDTTIVGEGAVKWVDDQATRWPSVILQRK